MSQGSLIPLTRARGFGPLPGLLEKYGGEHTLLRAFAEAGLPMSIRDEPARPIPHLAMVELFARSGHLLGSRTFGLEVGRRMRYQGYGLWADYCAGALTLGEALQRGFTSSWMHFTGFPLQVAREDRWVVWRYPYSSSYLDNTQHADHLLAPMLDFARIYLGPNWQPDWVQVNYTRDVDAPLLESALGAPIRFGREEGVGIALRPEDLTHPRRPDLPRPQDISPLRSVLTDVVLRTAPEPARSLSAVVAMRLLDGRSDIEGAARLSGLSVQSLQRHLRQQNYTYRAVLDAARRARAVELLLNTQLPLLDIALCIGYEDHATFTRAFRRWMGCSPSEFRRAARNGQSLTP